MIETFFVILRQKLACECQRSMRVRAVAAKEGDPKRRSKVRADLSRGRGAFVPKRVEAARRRKWEDRSVQPTKLRFDQATLERPRTARSAVRDAPMLPQTSRHTPDPLGLVGNVN